MLIIKMISNLIHHSSDLFFIDSKYIINYIQIIAEGLGMSVEEGEGVSSTS